MWLSAGRSATFLQGADWCGVTDEIHFGGGGGRRVEDVPSDVPSENQQEESENDYSFPQRSFLFLWVCFFQTFHMGHFFQLFQSETH